MSYWNDKRVVVTGGGGFLGSHVLEKLREAGCENVLVVRSKDYDLTKETAVERLFDDLRAGRAQCDSGQAWPAKVPGREAPLDFFRRSGVPIRGEWSPRSFVSFGLFMALCVFIYNWKSFGSLNRLFVENEWFPYNLSKLSTDAATFMGTLYSLPSSRASPTSLWASFSMK